MRISKKQIDLWFKNNEKLFSGSIGYCDYKDRKTLVLIISAARNLCGVRRKTARKLLLAALAEIDPKAKDLM